MRAQILAGLLVAGCGSGLPGLAAWAQERPPGEAELTIRNVSGATVSYRIQLTDPPDAEVSPRTLEPDAIDRFGNGGATVWFQQGAQIKTYGLVPGPYSFRLDAESRLELYLGSHGREDVADLAPWVPAPRDVVNTMLDLAGVTADDVVYDLGCGDGRIVVAAADLFGARGVGVDIDPVRIRESNDAARVAGVEELVEFRVEDAMKTDVSSATVLGLYLLEESLGMLRPNLERQMRSGARLVTLNYPVPGWDADRVEVVTSTSGEAFEVYLYVR